MLPTQFAVEFEPTTVTSETGAVDCRGLNTAMVGLQGGGPLISLELEVLNPVGEYSPAHSEPSSSSASSFDHIGSLFMPFFTPSPLQLLIAG